MVHEPLVPPAALRSRVGSGSDPAVYNHVGRAGCAALLDALPPGVALAGARVLDFGCGAGRTLRHLMVAAPTAELWGCDVHAPSINWLRAQLVPPLHVLRNGPAPPLRVDGSSFDLVYGLSVFTHLDQDWSAWLLELRRVLRPGGLVVLTFLGPAMWEEIMREPWDDDAVGMFVTRPATSDRGRVPVVFHSPWWIREHWGRAFEVVSVEPWGFGVPASSRAGHGWAVLRKDERVVDRVELEAVDPSATHEIRAIALNHAYLAREAALQQAEAPLLSNLRRATRVMMRKLTGR